MNPLNSFRARPPLFGTTAGAEPQPPSRDSTTRAIGSDLEALRRELIVCGRELESAPPFRESSFVGDMLRVLARLTCRIAVIGQVKAGKSRFINGLVRRPGLLPVDVNPWTTAVTQLHFGRADAPPNLAAQFTFFDADEWERLAHGGGYIRELTQRLVPGFEVQLLQNHVDAMRIRSEQRLGPALGKLLGRSHEFPILSPGVLERYVCAGMPSAENQEKGIYSDIVKTADIYFNSSDFGFPTTIIDTPGTNDPFLVRDEITRRSLENADIYIVLLTARQALSSSDVALLRILRGLHKDRLVVFINRIDELGDVAADLVPIMQQVSDGLHREFPGSQIPIVAGSALWAETASSGSQAEIERVLTPKVMAYARYLAGNAGSAVLGNARNEWKEEGAFGLFQCSGLPFLIDVLARLAPESHAGRVLTQISRSFSELGRLGQNAARHEVSRLETDGALAISKEAGEESELRAIEAEAQACDQLIAALQSLLSDLQQSTDKSINDQCARMTETLRNVVQGFSNMECESMYRAIADGHSGRMWTCDTTLVRQQLEEYFILAYREAEQEIGKLETQIFPQLKQLLKLYNPQWGNPDQGTDANAAADLPVLSALSEVVALDLDQPWWKHWWAPRRSAEGRVAELDRVIRNEFHPIVEKLVQAARDHLTLRQSSTLQEAKMAYVGLAKLLKEHSRARLERARELAARGELTPRPELQHNLDVRIGELREQVSSMEAVVRRLENVERMWAAKMGLSSGGE